MNYRSIVLAVCIIGAGFAMSCRRSWACECEVGTYGGVANTGASQTYTATIKDSDKKTGQAKCDEVGKENTTNGTYVCHIH